MNLDQLKGNWKELKGQIREQWGKLTDDEIDEAEGDREQIVGLVQKKYGKTREEAERAFDDWMSRH